MKLNNIIWSFEKVESIYDCIKNISDIEDQKKVWQGKYSPKRVGSYIEYICRLYDDCFFDDFIDYYLVSIKTSIEFKEKIEQLREKLNDFDGSKMKHNEIFKHPKWIEISKLAKESIVLWKENEFSFPINNV